MRQNEYDEIDKPWRVCEHGSIEVDPLDIIDFYLDDNVTLLVEERCIDCDMKREQTINYQLKGEVIKKTGEWYNG